MTQIAIGKKVPDFTAPTTSDDAFRLSEHRGKIVVLYFYPKDSTPGCTLESQDFRDLHAKFKRAGAVIYGISRDSIKSHEKFKCAQEMPFELISDADEQLCTLFDVIRMKNMYGKQVRGIERSTFLIDAEGKLHQEWRKVKVENHAAEVLEAVKALAKE
ncbi:MAG: peroxiredoxin [Chromatiales bacterium]|jgi:peroxiredoxin Q/BCP|nr:peroxiredoxin [Chromatiales bacterium]